MADAAANAVSIGSFSHACRAQLRRTHARSRSNIALLAGILIQLKPRRLNHIVAYHLVRIGVMGMFGISLQWR